MTTEIKGPVNPPVPQYPGLRPFPKGVSGNPGGKRREVAKVQRALAKMYPKVAKKLEALIDSDNPDLYIEGLKLWCRYMLPVPTEKQVDQQAPEGRPNQLSALLASRAAAMNA